MARKSDEKSSQLGGISKIVRKEHKRQSCQANILPCKVRYDGRVNASDRYWTPRLDADGVSTAYFRGRKLRGRPLKLPSEYEALVVKQTSEVTSDGSLKAEVIAEFERDSIDSDPAAMKEDEEELQDAFRKGEYDVEELHAVDELALIDRVVVWGHDDSPNETHNEYSKAVHEWIGLAHAMHGNAPES